VQFKIRGLDPNQFSVFLNGSVVPGSTYGTGWHGFEQATAGMLILTLASGDVLTVRNQSNMYVMLDSMAVGSQGSVNASILIRKLQ
jgi:hypothetical protein